MLRFFAKHQKLIMVSLCLMALSMMFAPLASANTSNGTEFQTLYDSVVGWVTGLPAIIIAIAICLMGVVRAFQSGSFIWALAGILVAALIFLLPTLISGLGGATI
jgi:conjugal transfer pilus assembly protein TraA